MFSKTHSGSLAGISAGHKTAPAIQATRLSKCYQLYNHPRDRLKQFLWRGKRNFFRELWALHPIDLTVAHGEIVGIIGQNGSGKSTLLQLICGTLTPTSGEIHIDGRIAALLELGAGFNPEFTGRENIYMSATILGLSASDIDNRMDDIIDFSGIRDFIDQPVKTYSSGMFVRLAFSVAINVDPEILVIDEALSVGDGAFSRKSFNRIMQLRDEGKTILFCSHSMFQVESLCSRAIWLNHGKIMAEGNAANVITEYQLFLDKIASSQKNGKLSETQDTDAEPPQGETQFALGSAYLKDVNIFIDGKNATNTPIISGKSSLSFIIAFKSDPALPCPNIGITIQTMDARTITSAATWEDHILPDRQPNGTGSITLNIDAVPLLKGDYLVNVHLLCERGIHIYDSAKGVAKLSVKQESRLQGFFAVPHRWSNESNPGSNP